MAETNKLTERSGEPEGRSSGVPLDRVDLQSRILIYGINFLPEPIGVGRYTGQIANYLVSQGIHVDVVTAIPHYPGWAPRDNFRNWYATETAAGMRVVRCPLLLKANINGIWRIIAPLSFAITSLLPAIWLLLRRRPHTLLCVEPTLLSAPLAQAVAKMLGIRTVLHVQDLEIDAAFAVGHVKAGWFRRLALAVERVVLKQFDCVVTISKKMQARLAEKGVRETRLELVRNWVDLKKLKPLSSVSVYRNQLGISEDTFVVLYSGNIGAKQGLHVMLEAASRLKDVSGLLFVIAGDGPEKAGLLEKYGHLSNVQFLPIQPEAMLCELLNLANVHLLPQEPGAADLVLPSKLGGMLASGKSCIVMAEANTELYDFLDGVCTLVSPHDCSALDKAIVDTMKASPRGGEVPGCVSVLDADYVLPDFARILTGSKKHRHSPSELGVSSAPAVNQSYP